MLPLLLRALGLLPLILPLVVLSLPWAPATAAPCVEEPRVFTVPAPRLPGIASARLGALNPSSSPSEFIVSAGGDVVVVRGAEQIVLVVDGDELRLGPDGNARFESDGSDRLQLNGVEVEGKATAGPGDVVTALAGQGEDEVVTHSLTIQGSTSAATSGLVGRLLFPSRPKAIGVTTVALGDARARDLGLDGDQALVIAGVRDDMPAAASLRAEDVIVAVNGSRPVDRKLLVESIQARDVGEAVTLTVVRDGETITVEVPVAQLPEDLSARSVPGLGELDVAVGNPLATWLRADEERALAAESLARAKELLARRATEDQLRIRVGSSVDRGREVADRLQAELEALESALTLQRQSLALLPDGQGGRTLLLPPSGLRSKAASDDQLAQVQDRLDSIDERLARIEELLGGLDAKQLLR